MWTLTCKDANLFRQWFDAVEDLNDLYLDTADYLLAKELYEFLDMRVPRSISDKVPTTRGGK